MRGEPPFGVRGFRHLTLDVAWGCQVVVKRYGSLHSLVVSLRQKRGPTLYLFYERWACRRRQLAMVLYIPNKLPGWVLLQIHPLLVIIDIII
jgi:hypothetical protein